jgi:hypothetical protein
MKSYIDRGYTVVKKRIIATPRFDRILGHCPL